MATIYLSADTGNDTTGNGSSLAPYLTIAKAHTVSTSGDTIIFKASAAAYDFANQTFTKNLTILGEKTDIVGAVLDGLNATRTWTYQANITVKYLRFKNTDNGISWPGGPFSIDGTGLTINMSNNIFDNLMVGGRTGFAQNGLLSAWNGTYTNMNITFSNNLVLPTVRSNDGTLGLGVYLNFIRFNNSIMKVDNNTVHNSDQAGYRSMYIFINAQSCTGSSLYARNNIVYSEDDVSLAFVSGNTIPALVVSDSNCRYGIIDNIPASDVNAITSDPLFVDKANYNYNLRPASLCIDSGVLI